MTSDARRPLLVTIVLLILIVPLLAGGGIAVRGLVTESFRTVEQTRAARLSSFALLENQLDEETGLRGFAATDDTLFLQPYQAGRAQFDATAARLTAAVDVMRLPDVSAAVADAKDTNAIWLRTVAAPLLARRSTDPSLLQRRGKTLVDHFRTDLATVDAALVRRDTAADAEARVAIGRIMMLVLGAVLAIGLLALGFLLLQARLASRLEAERLRAEAERRRSVELAAAYAIEKRIADTLQEAFSQRPLPTLPMLRFSAMYVPATEESKVGGDWYDALEMPNERVLFAIGDVAGHGLDAAVGMSRARQALITSALLEPDPASVLARVNRELLRDRAPMVTAVAGFADSQSYEFVYAIAGHPPPLLIEPGRAPRLLSCGDLPLGALESARYQTHRFQTVPGAMLVLYTDGAVEHSHDPLEGEAMLLAAAARCCDDPAVDPATAIHRAIFAGRPAGDDVAILTIGFDSERALGVSVSGEQGQSSFAGHLARDPKAAVTPLSAWHVTRRLPPRPAAKRKAS